MKIVLIEPFLTGSHQLWAQGFQQFCQHEVRILSLPGRHWKWRMYAGAVELAKIYNTWTDFEPDLLLATDMLDFTTFLAITRKKTAAIPTAIYFHENQITYPWSDTDPDLKLKRDNQYGFINYTSALVADQIFFNSPYHQQSFLEALPAFLKQFPDYKGIDNIPSIVQKSKVLPLGVDLKQLEDYKMERHADLPLLLWNHRWEYDKNPVSFFKALYRLKAEGIPFEVAILGTSYHKVPPIFQEAKKHLAQEIIQFGVLKDFREYAKWLWKADILPVTNNQDFFGQSVVEAIYCNCFPILPNRLAYPMHIPTNKHTYHFYDAEESFYQLLKQVIRDYKDLKNHSYQNFVSHYDWRILAAQYDDIMVSLKLSKKT